MSDIDIRSPAAGDETALATFLDAIREADQRFLLEDISDARAVLQRWLAEPPGHRLIALDGADIVGLAAATPGIGWSSHVAKIEVIVAISHRRRGLGRTLARRVLVMAFELGCTHVSVEVVAEQSALVAMFEELGFEPEALLQDFVRDSAGQFHDLMVLTHRAHDQASILATAGLDRPDG
jgi:ribosomal protein S18 acetylase RimI-like enzyme